MVKNHLKRLAMPRTWPIKRKKTVFITRPFPSGQKMQFSMPINLIFKEIIKLARTSKEVTNILNDNEVFINNTRIRDSKLAMSLMDVLKISSIGKYYRMVINRKNKLDIIEISEKDAELLPLKIKDKTTLKKGIIQLNFTNGFNLNIDKDSYKTGDVIIYDLKNSKIQSALKFENNMLAYITGGSYAGYIAKISKIDGKTVFLSSNDSNFETISDYIFVIGKDKPEIKLEKTNA